MYKRLFLGSALLGLMGFFLFPAILVASISGMGGTPNGSNPTGCQSSATAATTTDGSGLSLFLSAIRWHESRDDYTAQNPGSSASGAYQFLTSTWASEAKAAGLGQWAGGPASAAPADVQDAVAAFMATNAFDGPAQGEWLKVADIWFIGHPASDAEMDVSPPGNGGLTPRAYEAQIAQLMSGIIPQPPAPSQTCLGGFTGSPAVVQTAISYALAQVGKPYEWGATGPATFDCSGLTMMAYRAAGIDITRTTYTQVLRGTAVTQAQLQPGDLVFPDPGHVQLVVAVNPLIIVEAPHTGSFVQLVPEWGPVWQARRIVNTT